MIIYNVRSRRLMDIVSDIKRKKLIMSPFFQRKLVWRTIHKIDFIETILKGYPFPEIFIAKADIDIERMTTRDCIVDGQQRLNAIVEYLDDKFEVDARKYSQLDPKSKEEFLKYEIAIIELDINKDDPEIIEIFKRLNRTFYSLTVIEKLSSEFGPSELMLLAKLISGELKSKADKISVDEELGESETDDFDFDPDVPEEFIRWSNTVNVSKIRSLITEYNIFSEYEISRQVHLMFSLNILGTILKGIYNRNIDRDLLDKYSDNFEAKERILKNLEEVAAKILKLKLKRTSTWFNKANMFSLIYSFYKNKEKILEIPEQKIKEALEKFEETAPEDFRLAAKEGVNNKKERTIRDKCIQKIINDLVAGKIS